MARALGASPQQVSAIGGGQTVAPSAYVTVASGVTGSTASTPSVVQNDYIIVVVGFEGTAHTVSTVTDSATPATSFSKEASSNINEDVEVWCGKYTASSGSDTITVQTSTSASYSFRAIFAAGISSCTPDTTVTNHGNAGSPSVGSFTPNTGDFCEAATSDATGSGSSVWTIGIPFNSQGYYSNTASNFVLQSKLTSGSGWVADTFKGDWDSSYGATTAAFTSSVNSSPLWDEAVACFPTSSTGDEMLQGRGFFTRASSSNPNFAPTAVGGEGPIHNDYIVAIITLPVSSSTSHVTSVTDGVSDTYTQVISSGTNDDVEIWMAHYTGTSGTSLGQITFNLNVAEPAVIGYFEISGINTIIAQIATNSGSGSVASVASFTPDTNDVCIESTSFNAGTNPVTWTTPANQPFQQVSSTQQANGYNNNYLATAFRADWPASTSTTATLSPSATSSPAWDEVVACWAGSVVVPVTCTMSSSAPAATVALSESSGNTLSPSTVTCNGSPQNITVDPSVTLTATEPADSSNTRDRFSGGGTTTTDATCVGTSAGTCASWSFTNFEQLKNTFQISANAQSTFDSGLSAVTVSGTQAGGAATLCSITVTVAASDSCAGIWSDYAAIAAVPSTIGGAVSNTQWLAPSATSASITTGGGTVNFNYYKQLQNTYQASPSVPSTWNSGGLSLDGAVTSAGSCASPCTLDISTSNPNDVIVVAYLANAGSTVSAVVDSGSAGLTFTTRFACAGSQRALCEYYSGATSAALASEPIKLTASGGGNVLIFAVHGADIASPWDANSGLPNEAAGASGTGCIMSTTNGNDMLLSFAADGGSPVFTVPAQSGGYTQLASEFGGGPSAMGAYDIVSATQSSVQTEWTYTAGTAQYESLCDAIQGNGVAVSGTQAGTSGQTICLTNSPTSGGSSSISCSGWTDYNTPVTVGFLTVSPNVRWSPATSTYTDTTGGNTHADDYYEQLQNTYQASPTVPATWDVSGVALDGSNSAICTALTSCSATLTTTHSGDVVIAECYANTVGSGGAVTSLTVSASGLSFTQRLYYSSQKATGEDYAIAAGTLSSLSISCATNVGAGNVNIGVMVFGISGANTASPYDTNSNLPNKQSSSTTTGQCTMTTSKANDFLIAETSHNGASLTGTPAGFTALFNVGGSPSGALEYEVVTSIQSSVTETWTYGAGSFSDNICDAVAAALSGVTVTGTYLGSAGQSICTTNLPTSGASTAIGCTGWTDYNTAASMGYFTVSSNERWAPLTASYMDTTGGNTHSDSYYEQLQNTYQATPLAQTTWDAGLTAQAVVGTQLGASGQTICSIILTSGAGAQSCAAYADYNLAVVIGSGTISGAPANSQWVRSGACSFTQTAGGNTNNCNYYKQWTETWQATANAQSTFDSGLSANVRGTVLGASSTLICTISPAGGSAIGTCSGFIDNNQPATFDATMAGAASNTQWKCATCTTGSQTTGGNTVNINYYKQLSNTYQASTNGQGPPTWDSGLSIAPTGTSLGSGATICTMNPSSGTTTTASCTGYADYNTVVTYPALAAGSASNVRWKVYGTLSFTDTTGGNTHTAAYYKQLSNTYQSSTNGQGPPTWDSGLTIPAMGTLGGTSGQVICTISPSSGTTTTASCTAYADYNRAVSEPTFASGSGANIQWQVSGTSAWTDLTGGNTHTGAYYKQLSNTFQTTAFAPSTFDAGMTWSITGTVLGSAGTTICTVTSTVASTDSCTGYSDYNAAATFPASSTGAPANSRWENAAGGASNTASITSGGSTLNTNYYKQYSETWTATANAQSTFDPGSSSVATVSVGSGPMYDAYDSGKGEVFVVNNAAATISVISDSTNTVVATISGLGNPRGIVYDPAKGELFVANFGSGTVLVISDSTNTVVATVTVGSTPRGVSYDSALGEIFVANSGSNTVSVISDSTNTVVATVTVGSAPRGVVYDSAEGETFVTNNNDGTVSVIQDSTNTVVATVTVGTHPNGLTYDPAQAEVFVVCSGSNAAYVISDSTNTVVATVTVGNNPFAAVYDSAADQILVSNFNDGTVSVIRGFDNAVVATVTVGTNPYLGLAYDSAKGETFVTNNGANTVSILTDSMSTTVMGTVLGVAGSTVCTILPPPGQSTGTCSGFIDSGQAATYSTLMSGGWPNQQWICTTCTTGAQGTGGNYPNINYYKQLYETYQATTNGQGSPTWDVGLSIGLTGTTFGTPATTICTINPSSGTTTIASCSGYADYNSAVTFPGSAAGSGSNIQWKLYGTSSFTPLTGGNTYTASYYKQLSETYQATTNGQGPPTWDAGLSITLTGTLGGVPSQVVCTISPSSGTTTTASCSAYADYDTLVTAPAFASGSGSGIQWQVSGTDSWTDVTGGNTHTSAYYKQLSDTYVAAPNTPTTFSGSITFPVTGTYLGAASSTICTVNVPASPAGGTSYSCTAYADYNTAATFPPLSSSNPVNVQWQARSTTSFADTTANNSHTVQYYEEVSNTYSASPLAPATFSGSITFTVSGNLNGGASTICTVNVPGSPASGAYSCSGFSDYNTPVSLPVSSGSNPSNVRWEVSGSHTFSDTTGGNSHSANYYEQLQDSYEVTANAQATFDPSLAFTLTGTLFGSAGSTICVMSPASNATDTCVAWADYNTQVSYPTNPVGSAPNSRWEVSGTSSFTDTTGGNTHNVNYYKQYTNSFAYSVMDGGSPAAPALICTQLGSSGACGTLGLFTSAIWVDSGGSYSATNPTTGSTGTERWDSNAASGVISSGGVTIAVSYYHQYLQTLSYSVIGGGSPTSPTASGLEFGSAYTPSLTGSPTGYWFDATGTVSFTDPISGGANEQWSSPVSSISATSSATTALVYYNQYQNTYQAVPRARTTYDGVYPITVTGTFEGVGGSTICTITTANGGGTASCSGYADSGILVSMGSISGAPANTRWQQSGVTSWTDGSGGNTHAVNFYDQTTNTYTFSPTAPATWDNPFSPVVTGTLLGVPSSTVCTASLASGGGASSCNGYTDYNSAASFPAAIADGANVQWTGAVPLSFSDTTGGNIHTVDYYLQYSALTFTADPIATTTWDNSLSVTVTGTYLGTAVTVCTITTTSGGGSAS
ncbi:MAG: YncE family protein, partial [Thaumarchaeota archaeon]|nr:YncE family protein [Nitrososphaerota archaeon]